MNAEGYATHREGFLVPGEYNVVVRFSRDVDSLLLVHSLPLDRQAARRLLDEVLSAHIPDVSVVKVRFGSKAGHASYRKRYRREVTHSYQRWDGSVRKVYRRVYTGEKGFNIALPSKERRPATADCLDWSGLRVGLILHEAAHVIEFQRHGGMWGHGSRFTAILDELVAWWRERTGM